MKLAFHPARVVRHELPEGMARVGDRIEGSVYVYSDDIILAVNVALATQRPLLIAGPPGSGKSSLALSISRVMDWAYEEDVITPRTQARDLLWRYDAVARLRDAQAGDLDDSNARYVTPGVLWRAFKTLDAHRTVVLLDEVDKADPDVPNSLLEVLGTLSFTVSETGEVIRATETRPPFVVLTTNEERELSRPFLRRCVFLRLRRPGIEELIEIAEIHGLADDETLTREAARLVVDLAAEAEAAGQPAPSTAEFIDALRAARELHVHADDPEWRAVMDVTLVKRTDVPAR